MGIEGLIRTVDWEWTAWAVETLKAEYHRTADTHLLPVEIPQLSSGITLYLKDESGHPTGSLKHRLARSLFLYGICNGRIGLDTVIVESSSGSTAVSEAYFSRLLGLRFVAIVPRSTAQTKIDAINAYGGECQFVDHASEMHDTARSLAEALGGHYVDQFTYAERATDWRGNNNIAESIFHQMELEPHPVPRWIVCGAGTGGTAAAIGRYIRYCGHRTRICMADPVSSVFHRHWQDRDVIQSDQTPSLIEGIGRPCIANSFLPELIDRVEAVTDAQSIASMRAVSQLVGKECGGSTGTNFWVCMKLIGEMRAAGEQGSIVSILCDDGERYRETLYNDAWLEAHGIDLAELDKLQTNIAALND